jgi:hypothetical protein
MPPISDAHTKVKIADQVWIATLLLHKEKPEQSDFTVDEIVERVAQEAIDQSNRTSVYVHVLQHCVANRPPNPARYRMLLETSPGRRRLFRNGDAYHPAREGAKITPNVEDLPQGYRSLLIWYRDWCSLSRVAPESDSLLALAGSGKHLWKEEHADDYVRRLREDWE